MATAMPGTMRIPLSAYLEVDLDQHGEIVYGQPVATFTTTVRRLVFTINGQTHTIELGDTFDGEPIVASPASLGGWTTAYGVTLASIGEDGDWIALGHVRPLRMIAAMRKGGRELYGLCDDEVFGDGSPLGWSAVDNVRHMRAVITETAEEWAAHWSTEAQAHPKAIDVTVFRA